MVETASDNVDITMLVPTLFGQSTIGPSTNVHVTFNGWLSNGCTSQCQWPIHEHGWKQWL